MEQQQTKTEEPEAQRFSQQHLDYPNQPLAFPSSYPQITTGYAQKTKDAYPITANKGYQPEPNNHPTAESQGHMEERGESPSNNTTTVVMTVS